MTSTFRYGGYTFEYNEDTNGGIDGDVSIQSDAHAISIPADVLRMFIYSLGYEQ